MKYPDFEIRRLIYKFKLSDHSLAMETGRYKEIPRHLRTCNNCETLDGENHFFLNCNLNEHLRKILSVTLTILRERLFNLKGAGGL